ncbi:palmitoyltransferase ZDHHC15 isoform X1 [Monodelphis domestica]|uniref:Palmitoyltransferase n=1 Tax=Monodelphis domestica TaxID=13616 RepID=F7DTF9_MONDO|nr:palmitoyltransferase ZDHHC15 isoform X1 [Monodelphis domestica]XP_016282252.1 palmitoyltransferase ZDHHC15 isoform X1 [Monodelphis domestica]
MRRSWKMALSGGLRCCRRMLAWVPVLVIVLVVLWSYYAYVFELCVVTVANTIEKVIYLTVYHALFAFFIWTYWKSIFTLPHQPHQKFFMSYGDKERYENEERPEVQKQMLLDIAKKLPVYTRTGNGAVRFCDRCHLIKPDRCHHCSVCSMCVLKMDHHCPWVNNCIGFSNYKFFLQFLAYSVLYCLYIAATVFQYFIKYWVGDLPNTRSKFHVLFLLFVACMFFVSLMILFGYHCWLLSRNKTTLEAFSAPVFLNGPDKNGFNLGFIKNFQQVFGENKKLWLLPIGSSPGDGHSFPMRSMNESQNPLLANEEHWEDNEEDGRGSEVLSRFGERIYSAYSPQAMNSLMEILKRGYANTGSHEPDFPESSSSLTIEMET